MNFAARIRQRFRQPYPLKEGNQWKCIIRRLPDRGEPLAHPATPPLFPSIIATSSILLPPRIFIPPPDWVPLAYPFCSYSTASHLPNSSIHPSAPRQHARTTPYSLGRDQILVSTAHLTNSMDRYQIFYLSKYMTLPWPHGIVLRPASRHTQGN